MAQEGDSLQSERHRSPNYPAEGLRGAVERLRKLYRVDGKAGAPKNIAAVHIGFSKPHGQAMAVIAALKKFGLVESRAGRIVPSQRGLEIINLADDDPRRKRALRDALLGPAAYRELIEQHQSTGLPSADSIESELVTYKNFNPKHVAKFVREFVDSIEFAGLSDFSALTLEPGGDGAAGGMNSVLQDRGREQGGTQSAKLQKADVAVWLRMREDVFSVPEGRVTLQWPAELSAESIQDIKDWLEIAQRKIERSKLPDDSR